MASLGQAPASPILHAPGFDPGLAHSSLAAFAGEKLAEVEEASSQPPGSGRQDTGEGGSLREQEAHIPGDEAIEEPLWPDGHSSQDAGDLDFYMKYAKF